MVLADNEEGRSGRADETGVVKGDHIYHDITGRYLGKVYWVGRVAVKFKGPAHRQGGLATIHEIKVGDKPDG